MKIHSYLDSGAAVLDIRLRIHTQLLDDRLAYLVALNPEAPGKGLARLLSDVTSFYTMIESKAAGAKA